MERFVHAIFPDEQAAANAVQELLNAGFPSAEIGALFAKDSGRVEQLPVNHKTAVAAGAVLGAVLGATGGVIALAGMGLVAAGSLFGALQGVVTGGAAGTLMGALGGLGLWKDEIDFPSEAFTRGAVLVGVVTPEGRVGQARQALEKAGATGVDVSTKSKAAEAALEKKHMPSTNPDAESQYRSH